MLWAALRWLGTWGWRGFAVSTAIIGVAGLPDDFKTWSKWIDAVVNDPLVTALAEWAVAIAGFVNQPWFRITLVIVGMVMIIWPLRWFWRVRHRFLFKVRQTLSEEVWIDRGSALTLIRNSRWAGVRQPKPTIGDMVRSSGIFGDTESIFQKRIRKFDDYCAMALDRFEKQNPQFARWAEGNKQYSEGKIREYLDEAYTDELEGEFGPLPDVKLER